MENLPTPIPRAACALERIPVIEHVPVRVAPGERARVERQAARLLAGEPALPDTETFGRGVASGMDDGPAVVFEDHSEIALVRSGASLPLQYRALLLAGEGDVTLVGTRRSPAFEAYCRDILGLGQVAVLSVAPSPAHKPLSLAHRCLKDLNALGVLIDAAKRHRRLTLVPYIGTASAWLLAGRVAAETGARVQVAAPPPRLTRRVNDKLWFASQVKQLLGSEALPPTFYVFGAAALASRVRSLARRFERVVIKVPDSAGSAGNLVLRSETLSGLSLRALRSRLLRLLRGLGWRASFPLMVGMWHCAVLASPSAQVWIPRREDGPPLIEGLFDQIVQGSASEFVGAVRCTVPEAWQRRMAEETAQLACLFQALGYFGRCSFDAVIAGTDYATAALHWIECNGRWGGTSMPMTLANRLVGDWSRRALMIVQRGVMEHEACDVPTALERLGPMLFRGGQSASGIVLLTPGGLEAGTGMNFLLLGADHAEIARQAEALGTLFGAPPRPD